MKMFFLGVGVLIFIGLGAAAWTTSRGGYETAPYTVVRQDGAFEIREYPELKIATTPLSAENESFMRLFRYIGGSNEKQEKIAMTTPVFMVDGKMAFVMPPKGQLTPSKPSSEKVTMESFQSRRVAVYRYSGSRGPAGEAQALEKLRAWMGRNHLVAAGKPFSAYYDPPWTPGFLRRNEVLVSLAGSP